MCCAVAEDIGAGPFCAAGGPRDRPPYAVPASAQERTWATGFPQRNRWPPSSRVGWRVQLTCCRPMSNPVLDVLNQLTRIPCHIEVPTGNHTDDEFRRREV